MNLRQNMEVRGNRIRNTTEYGSKSEEGNSRLRKQTTKAPYDEATTAYGSESEEKHMNMMMMTKMEQFLTVMEKNHKILLGKSIHQYYFQSEDN